MNDLPKKNSFPKTTKLTTFGYSPTFYEQPTNGLTYNSVSKDLTLESQEELNSLMILSALLGKVGAGDRDHVQLQKEISRISGGVSVSNHFFYDKNEELKGKTTLSSKFLPENTTETTKLIFEILSKTDLTHHERIKELMFQNFMGFQQSIVENGHRFAMLGASASHNKLSHIQESLGGLSAISKFAPFVTQQDDAMKQEIEKVANTYKKLDSMKSELLFVSNNKLSKNQINEIRAIDFKKDGQSKIEVPFTKTFNKVVFPINTQVNFSAMSMDAPLYDVKESPKFLILSSLLRNEFLHKNIFRKYNHDFINKRKVIETIDHGKDVDGFHPINVGNLSSGHDSCIPCTPFGCSLLLKQVEKNLNGKHIQLTKHLQLEWLSSLD